MPIYPMNKSAAIEQLAASIASIPIYDESVPRWEQGYPDLPRWEQGYPDLPRWEQGYPDPPKPSLSKTLARAVGKALGVDYYYDWDEEAGVWGPRGTEGGNFKQTPRKPSTTKKAAVIARTTVPPTTQLPTYAEAEADALSVPTPTTAPTPSASATTTPPRSATTTRPPTRPRATIGIRPAPSAPTIISRPISPAPLPIDANYRAFDPLASSVQSEGPLNRGAALAQLSSLIGAEDVADMPNDTIKEQVTTATDSAALIRRALSPDPIEETLPVRGDVINIKSDGKGGFSILNKPGYLSRRYFLGGDDFQHYNMMPNSNSPLAPYTAPVPMDSYRQPPAPARQPFVSVPSSPVKSVQGDAPLSSSTPTVAPEETQSPVVNPPVVPPKDKTTPYLGASTVNLEPEPDSSPIWPYLAAAAIPAAGYLGADAIGAIGAIAKAPSGTSAMTALKGSLVGKAAGGVGNALTTAGTSAGIAAALYGIGKLSYDFISNASKNKNTAQGIEDTLGSLFEYSDGRSFSRDEMANHLGIKNRQFMSGEETGQLFQLINAQLNNLNTDKPKVGLRLKDEVLRKFFDVYTKNAGISEAQKNEILSDPKKIELFRHEMARRIIHETGVATQKKAKKYQETHSGGGFWGTSLDVFKQLGRFDDEGLSYRQGVVSDLNSVLGGKGGDFFGAPIKEEPVIPQAQAAQAVQQTTPVGTKRRTRDVTVRFK